MTAWLVLGAHGFKDETRFNLDEKPCPTIGATGLGSYRYWIEDDGQPPPPRNMNKPPYRVPLISEIVKFPWNGRKVASTFSGAGGSCTGYRIAGCKVVWANEFVPIAQESYKANAAPGSILDGRDIKLVKPEDIFQATGLRSGELDIFDGSPPCQAFSTAGKREKGWGKKKKYEHGAEQCNEQLFDEYIRLLRGLRPKAFVAENVSGMVKGTVKGMFIEILQALKACGYRVVAKQLDAQWLGVPQSRTRIIFIGIRNDLNAEPEHPKPLPYNYTVRDALGYPPTARIVHPSGFGKDKPDSVDAPMPTVMARSEGIGGMGPGQTFLEVGTERRKFTIDEIKRICSFPDDFVLKGSYGQQWERLGNSVPPVMMSYIARAVCKTLDRVEGKR